MNEDLTELARWLSSGGLEADSSENLVWEPGFDVDRQVVVSKFAGVFQKIFLRPDDFVKRFYHQIFPLPIDAWNYVEQISLFDDFCSLTIEIDLHFQATLTFVQRNPEQLPNINDYIKKSFQRMITDIVTRELPAFNDGKWVKDGLFDLEQRISVAVCELLMIQNIQSQARCKIQADFKEFSNIKPGKDSVYLSVLKQSHELTEQKNQSFFIQQAALKDQKLQQKQEQLVYLKKLAEVERQKRAQHAEERLVLLADEEQHLSKELEIEKRIHAKRIAHQQQLRELEADAELASSKKIRIREQQVEMENHSQKQVHLSQLEQKKLQADLVRREQQLTYQAKIQEEKTQNEIERYEKQQKAWQDAKLRIHQQQLELKKRQKQLEDDLEDELNKLEQEDKEQTLVMPFQKLRKFEEVTRREKKSATLRNEIELTLLEKQRLELEQAINEVQSKMPLSGE